MGPEAKARLEIDKKLEEVGYVIQDKENFNPTVSLGVVLREAPTNSGPVDYLIFIDRVPVGVIEAKKTNLGNELVNVAEQSLRYIQSGIKGLNIQPTIRFAYEATDILIRYCDYKDIKARSREVFYFHKPEYLQSLLKDSDTLRNRLKAFTEFNNKGFRKCQTNAILSLEKSFAENKPRALIQMATGSGKTFTAITAVYRLLKHAKANRILFLVDTKNLGEQAEEEFRKYKPTDDNRLFSELYNVKRLNSSYISDDTHVCISTIQRMYSILRGEELDENNELVSSNEKNNSGRPKEVVYNKKYPIEFFDFIIIDECHRSIYNLWQQVLDYFDSFLIGLTATPDSRTFAFFNENIVSEYSHEQAVIDDVNVGRQGTYLIETQVGTQGGCILKQTIEKRERLSREKRWEQLDEDLAYTPSQLDNEIVNPSQIRNVIRAFKDKVLTEMFPGRKEVPKTLVFAKTDSHANDIIDIIREEFGEGNEFCKKITYGSDENPKSVLSAFRNDYYPRIAVTVDMIATGTDVKPIECLLFMRDVRSKNYFEQMLGRATRTLGYEDLKRVSPSATERKTGFIVVDAVGVTTSQKTTSRQLERKPTVSLKELLNSVIYGSKDEDTLTSLANRLIKLDKVLKNTEKDKISEITEGKSLVQIASELLDSFDEDVINNNIKPKEFSFMIAEDTVPYGNQEEKKSDEYLKSQIELINKAIEPIYNSDFRKMLLELKQNHEQIIDNTNIDKIIFAGWELNKEENAKKIIETFRNFIEENKNEIEALNIIYNQSYKNRPLTYKMVNEMYEKMMKAPYMLNNNILWCAYEKIYGDKVSKRVEDKLADIISLIKFELKQTTELKTFSVEVNIKFKDWVFKKNSGAGQFTEEQMEWLRMIRDHIATSMGITTNELELTPFNNKGGLARFFQLFGNKFKELIEELNYVLTS